MCGLCSAIKRVGTGYFIGRARPKKKVRECAVLAMVNLIVLCRGVHRTLYSILYRGVHNRTL